MGNTQQVPRDTSQDSLLSQQFLLENSGTYGSTHDCVVNDETGGHVEHLGVSSRLTTWSNQPLRQWDGPHIVSYNSKLLCTYGFFVRTGTVFDFRHRWIWVQVFLLFGVMAVAAWLVALDGSYLEYIVLLFIGE